MKLKSSLRRTATLLAGAVVGLTGVVAIAAPASAHSAAIKGVAACASGKNVVTWTITNDWETDATLDDLVIPAGTTPVDTNGHELTKGYLLPKAQKQYGKWSQTILGKAVFTQTVDAKDSATLSFTAKWPGWKGSSSDSETVELVKGCGEDNTGGECDFNKTAFTHTFALVDGKWKATVTLDSKSRLCREEPVTLVSYFTPQPNDLKGDNWPQYEYQSQTKTISDKQGSVDLEVEAPDCNTQVDLFFGDKVITPMEKNGARYGTTKLGESSGLGARSKGPRAWYNGGTKACTTPAVAPVSSCVGDLTLNLSNNGKFGKYDVTFTVKYGNETKTVTVAAGKADTLTVPAGAGDVKVSAPGLEEKTYSWSRPENCALPAVTVENDCTNVTVVIDNPKDVTTATAKVTYGDETKTVTVKAGAEEKATFKLTEAKFATVSYDGIKMEPLKLAVKEIDCSTPSATPSASVSTTPVASDEPSLPVTGAAAGSIAGIAILLLGGGVAMFFIARRRKTKFTA